MSSKTGAISVGGKTRDKSLIGTDTSFYPFLVFYEPENLSRKWEKYANMPKTDVKSLGFSPDGNELFGFFQKLYGSLSLYNNVIMLL